MLNTSPDRSFGFDSRKIPSLDGLRAISILLVIMGHASGIQRHSFLFRLLFVHHFLGVHVFFVISGFLITALLLKERNSAGTISLGLFYVRRVLRIFPAFYLFIGVTFVLYKAGLVPLPPNNFLYAVTYTMNFTPAGDWWTMHLWSLSVEEQFYLVWPLTVTLFSRGVWIGAAVAAIFIGPVLRVLEVVFGIQTVDSRQLYATPFVAGPLAMGCLLAIGWPRLQKSAVFLSFSASRASLLIVPLILFLDTPDLGSLNRAIGIVKDAAVTLFVARSMMNASDWAGRLLNSPPFQFVGGLSYSLYLWQQPFFDPFLHTRWNDFPLNAVGATAAALCSYYCVEKPFLRLRDRFRAGAPVATRPPVAAIHS